MAAGDEDFLGGRVKSEVDASFFESDLVDAFFSGEIEDGKRRWLEARMEDQSLLAGWEQMGMDGEGIEFNLVTGGRDGPAGWKGDGEEEW